MPKAYCRRGREREREPQARVRHLVFIFVVVPISADNSGCPQLHYVVGRMVDVRNQQKYRSKKRPGRGYPVYVAMVVVG